MFVLVLNSLTSSGIIDVGWGRKLQFSDSKISIKKNEKLLLWILILHM